jgi:maleate cis-trans isomerase
MRLEYGLRGTVAVLTPQANCTVEPELGVLLGPDVLVLTARMTSGATGLRERLLAYHEGVAGSLSAFRSMPIGVCVYACTGSTYLVGIDAEREAFGVVEARRGHPVVSAARAITKSLDVLDVERLGVVSPYPGWLTEAGVALWRDLGLEVVEVVSPEPPPGSFHPIYELRSEAVLSAVERLDRSRVQAVLLAGTGMPTLPTIAALAETWPVPLLSSNLALAWSAEEILSGRDGDAASLRRWLGPGAPWQTRLAERFPDAAGWLRGRGGVLDAAP